MAGIGFELRKLFDERGIISKLRAYAYTGAIVTGPMLLGIAFVASVAVMGTAFGIGEHDRALLLTMITYAMMWSLTVTGFVSMPLTRFVSDMLYDGRLGLVLPSLEGALAVVLPVSFASASAFQAASGQPFDVSVLNVTMVCELATIWLASAYLTAVKDYRAILAGYVISMATSIASGFLIHATVGTSVPVMLLTMVVGYAVMIAYDLVVLYRYFPNDHEHYLLWLAWVSGYKALVAIGVCDYVALFSVLVASWFGPEGTRIAALYHACPQRDVPAFFAFTTVLVSQVTFVASTETSFYPAYRHYYDLLNSDGSIVEVDAAQSEMVSVLERELGNLARKQLIASALAVATLPSLLVPIGDAPGNGFVIMCAAYCAYAIGNATSLMSLYLDDNRGAAASSMVFALLSSAGSLLSVRLGGAWYGVGFVTASLAYLFMSWYRLRRFVGRLPFTILAHRPVVERIKDGPLMRLSRVA